MHVNNISFKVQVIFFNLVEFTDLSMILHLISILCFMTEQNYFVNEVSTLLSKFMSYHIDLTHLKNVILGLNST